MFLIVSFVASGVFDEYHMWLIDQCSPLLLSSWLFRGRKLFIDRYFNGKLTQGNSFLSILFFSPKMIGYDLNELFIWGITYIEGSTDRSQMCGLRTLTNVFNPKSPLMPLATETPHLLSKSSFKLPPICSHRLDLHQCSSGLPVLKLLFTGPPNMHFCVSCFPEFFAFNGMIFQYH